MKFRKKAEFILAEQPDLLIVPECENQERLVFGLSAKQPTDLFWYGKNYHKGIGVFSYSNFKIKLLDVHNPDFKYVLPLLVYNDKITLTVFAIWAQKPQFHSSYVFQIWDAVHFYSNLLDGDNIILAGDFNSNTIWDKPRRAVNHTELVNFLKTKNILSTYHYFHHQLHGKEKHMTLFMHRKIDKPYHIDYCFASSNLLDKLQNVEIGTYEAWTKHSDHKPLIVKFDI